MASRIVAALACFALCHSSPVLLNGYIYRDGRSFSMGQAYGGNRATGSASINGGIAQAYGSASNDNKFGRNGFGEVYPGQLVAQAEAYDNPNTPYGGAKAVAEAQNTPTYYTVPAPATVVSYEQNFEVPQGSYQVQMPGAIVAESTAVINENSESSVSSVRNDGTGLAQSSAQTNGLGSYGVTSSNANTYGAGSASSNAKNIYESTITSAKTHGYGAATSKSQGNMGLTTAESQSNGGYGSASSTVNNAQETAAASVNTQGFGSASSNANINNVNEVVATSAKTGSHKSWRFGLLYGTPGIIGGSAHANSQSGAGGAKSTAQANGASYGTAYSAADTKGSGIANANANINGAGYLQSSANSQNIGYGLTKSTTNTQGYGSANSAANVNGYGSIQSTANTQGSGYANANADVNGGAVKTAANTNGYGSAASTVNTGPTFGTFKTYTPYGGTRTSVNAQTSGSGSAASSARSQGLQAGYKMVNSSANSSGFGTAQANAESI